MFTQEILVFHVNPYNFDDDKGVNQRGVSVFYLDPETPAQAPARGFKHVKATMPAGSEELFPVVPAVYDAELRPVPGAGNKLTLRLTYARLKDSVDMSELPTRLRAAQ